jgi:hypothetical protein
LLAKNRRLSKEDILGNLRFELEKHGSDLGAKSSGNVKALI